MKRRRFEKQKKERKYTHELECKYIGKAEDVAAEVAANEHIPQPIKDLVALLAEGSIEHQDGIILNTYGHHGGRGTGIGNVSLTIEPFRVSKPVKPSNVDAVTNLEPPGDLKK